MNQTLADLYSHQTWADAEHWKSFEAFPKSFEDEALRKRLHHIHLVQHAFLSIVRKDAQFRRTTVQDFPEVASLKEYARQFHTEMAVFLKGVSDARLLESITVPWFRDPALSLTTERALMQCAMHSHYHRGQNATRLRELGGIPPATDLIVWYWKGQPQPDWR